MSKPWGKIGTWAADSEAAEAEELAATAAADTFPSLQIAAATKTKKKTKMSLQEFTMATSASRLTPAEILSLPTGPKERSSDEMHQRGRLSGGFSNYGGGPGRPQEDRDGNVSWGGGGRRSYGGGFEHDDRRGAERGFQSSIIFCPGPIRQIIGRWGRRICPHLTLAGLIGTSHWVVAVVLGWAGPGLMMWTIGEPERGPLYGHLHWADPHLGRVSRMRTLEGLNDPDWSSTHLRRMRGLRWLVL